MTAPQAEIQGPAGFRPVQGQEPSGPRIDKDVLTGVILEFRFTRRFPRKRGKGDTVVHTFLAASNSKRFSVFGTADLDDKLGAVKAGSIIWLYYNGKRETDGQERHVWQVSDAGTRLDKEQLGRLLVNSHVQMYALDAAIDQAIVDASRRQFQQTGGQGAPDWDREFSDDEAL